MTTSEPPAPKSSLEVSLPNISAYRSRKLVYGGLGPVLDGGLRIGRARQAVTTVEVPPDSDLDADLKWTSDERWLVATYRRGRRHLAVNLILESPLGVTVRVVYFEGGIRELVLPYRCSRPTDPTEARIWEARCELARSPFDTSAS